MSDSTKCKVDISGTLSECVKEDISLLISLLFSLSCWRICARTHEPAPMQSQSHVHTPTHPTHKDMIYKYLSVYHSCVCIYLSVYLSLYIHVYILENHCMQFIWNDVESYTISLRDKKQCTAITVAAKIFSKCCAVNGKQD